MATIPQHNRLIKILFGNQKHFSHVMTDPQIKQMTDIEGRYPLTRLPVCGHCERLGMWDKGGVGVCKHCGTITKNPVTYSTYLASGYDVDPTGETLRGLAHRLEMAKRDVILPLY